MEVGFIGLGRMGKNMALRTLRGGHEVVVWNRSPEPVEEMVKAGAKKAASVKELVEKLKSPRVIWVMLPAGEVTEEMLVGERGLLNLVQENDIVIDAGNSFYKDTEHRSVLFHKRQVRYLGVGVSGGIVAAATGYPIMVGGDKVGYDRIKPLLDTLSSPEGGHDYFGPEGAGHFVKMLHNGIEYGIMQSLAEGFDVLEHAPYQFDLLKVGRLWQKGTLVSGFMLDRSVEVLEKDPHLKELVGVIDTSGEAHWTVDQAKEEEIPVEIIERSLAYRTRSKTNKKIQQSYTAKMVAALRNAFGAHALHTKK